jgi:hypothetical protein
MPINHVEIYAELTKKQYLQIFGVSMQNNAGSRSLFFTCGDSNAARELVSGLDSSAVNWQINEIDKEDEYTEEDKQFLKELNEF